MRTSRAPGLEVADLKGMAEPQLQSTLTCPHCGHPATEQMPINVCVVIYACKACGKELRPLSGDCCVFCSYGSMPCPPIQEARARDKEGCCGPPSARSRKDWLGSARASLLAWWLPHVAIIAGLFVVVPARTVLWVAVLVWMGTACLLNARRCGRTHCRITGPYYIAMIGPVLALGSGIVAAGLHAWIACVLLILVGDKIIWWATERAWGTYS
jgi:hypothetical protein